MLDVVKINNKGLGNLLVSWDICYDVNNIHTLKDGNVYDLQGETFYNLLKEKIKQKTNRL